MRILVTGGAGYIGSITTRHLLDAGHEVTVLDSLLRGRKDAVDPRARLIVGEVGDREAVRTALEGCDAVMHLAGLIEVGESQEHPGMYMDANLAQPAVMLEVMAELGVRSLVFSSTAAVYGEPDAVPIPETAPTRPINAYGLSKLGFEQLLSLAEESFGIRSVRFRYFNVAGAWPDGSLGEAHDPESHIIPRILGSIRTGVSRFEVYGDDYPTPDGTCVRDYIHVCDLAQAHRLGLESLHAGGSSAVYNLGSGDGFSNLQVVGACAEVTGTQVDVSIGPRRPGDPAILVASSERARAELGWQPAYPELETMIAHAWSWHSRS